VPKLKAGQLYGFSSYSTKYQSGGYGAFLKTTDLKTLRPGMVLYPMEQHPMPVSTLSDFCG
jgi:hypothetical protein